jgi:heterodisulfide reductase subunit B2
MALPMRNLILAEQLQNDVMTIPCASCYSRMKETKINLDKSPELRAKINKTIDEGTYLGTVEVKSLLQYSYEDIGIEAIKKQVVYPLTGLKIACYYGCLLTRPKNITHFDSTEYPMSMDKIVEALGATAVEFDYKTECCGASFSISNTDVVHHLSGKIIEVAKECGADLIAVGCPLCQMNLDLRQHGAEKALGIKLNVPVVYFTQLMALAFGFPEKELKFNKHIIPVTEALKKIQKPSKVTT